VKGGEIGWMAWLVDESGRLSSECGFRLFLASDFASLFAHFCLFVAYQVFWQLKSPATASSWQRLSKVSFDELRYLAGGLL